MKKYTIEELRKAVETSFTFTEVQKKLGYRSRGSKAYRIMKFDIKENNIDASHFTARRTKSGKNIYYDLSELLVENSTHDNNRRLKERLFREKVLKNECSKCKIIDWNNEKITLPLDHINGINNDNRINNLRILCPNCHSQTKTFSRNSQYKKPIKIDISKWEEDMKLEMLERKKEKKEIEAKKELVLNSNIDFKKLGWVNEVSSLLGIRHQKIKKWMTTNLPDFYKSCYKQKRKVL